MLQQVVAFVVPENEPILVTGGAGFIGSHVVRELVDRGHRVVALDDLSGGFESNVDSRATFVRGSILDVALIDRLFDEHGFTYVFHLAAYAAEGLSHFIRRFNYQNNLVGSVNLINASVRCNVRCFVFTSSIAVYGRLPPPVTEDMTPVPDDPYAIAKWAVENDLRVARDTFSLPFIVFRPHNVYGEGQNIGDRYRNVVGIFMNRVLQGLPLPVFGDGEQTRAFTHISDVAPIIASSIDTPEAYGETFNIGASQPVTVNALGKAVSHAMGVPYRPEILPARHEVTHVHARHEKAKKLLGFEAKVPLAEGVAAMAEWVRQVGARESQKFEGVEIERGLPRSWLE